MPKLQEKPSALKIEHPALQNMKILYFFLFLWVIFALLDPDPATQINADPCGSGSETLQKTISRYCPFNTAINKRTVWGPYDTIPLGTLPYCRVLLYNSKVKTEKNDYT
jgi:hypothetical protein